MSGYRNFIIAGSGSVGSHIIRELLKFKSTEKIDNVTILTRSVSSPAGLLPNIWAHTYHQDSSNLDEYNASGAKIVVVDYSSAESLKNAVTGADVVISTLTHVPAALQAQHVLAEQAKAAGVKLFVPSEFGDPTDRENPQGAFALKQSVHHKLKELDLPYALFFTGPHTDYVFIPYVPILVLEYGASRVLTSRNSVVGLDLKSGNVTAGLDGNALNSFTTQPDIGRFVAYVLTNLPRSKLEWQIFRIEAERKVSNIGRMTFA